MTALTKDKLLSIYRCLWEVRLFEEQSSSLYRDGQLPGFIHVSLGQEACSVGACAALEKDDYITSTHRGHGHCLAKGADPVRMMAELFGKERGYSKGRGGSMHIADISAGVLGANGIVGQSSPLAIGAAMTSQVKGLDRVALAFFGEGASGAGPTMEAMNIAALWHMPVIFFCEANRYAELSPFSTHCPTENVSDRAKGFGFEGLTIDGTDVIAVYEAVKAAADKARNNGGPTLIEAKTHRWHGHFEGDAMKYVSSDDKNTHVDPIEVYEARLRSQYSITEAQLEMEKQAAIACIADAVEFSRTQSAPSSDVILEDVYA